MFGQMLPPRFSRQLDGQGHELQGLLFAYPPGGKTLGRGLVAGGGGDIGAGRKVLAVDVPDQAGLFQQDLGGPEVLVQVASTGFEFRCQGAVGNQAAPWLEHKGQGGSSCGGTRAHTERRYSGDPQETRVPDMFPQTTHYEVMVLLERAA